MLKFKQRLIENWNGYDYPEFINSYGFKPDLLPDNFDKKQLESQWNNELHQWGGANAHYFAPAQGLAAVYAAALEEGRGEAASRQG